MIDWKHILEAYIDHVFTQEGHDFLTYNISQLKIRYPEFASKLTDEEAIVLLRIVNEEFMDKHPEYGEVSGN